MLSTCSSLSHQQLELQRFRADPRTNAHTREEVKLCSGVPSFDAFLNGGLALGTVSEWGIPFGCGGRELLVKFIATLTGGSNPAWCLWAYARQHCQAYPLAWHGRGVNLRWLRFAHTESPVRDLKSLFLDPTFKLIVIDQPVHLTDEDIVFMAQQARHHKRHIMVVRDRWLASGCGVSTVRYRLNCGRSIRQPWLTVESLRGAKPGVLKLGASYVDIPRI